MSDEPGEPPDRIPPSPVLSAVPVVDYSTPPQRNRNATRALLFALFGFLPYVPGILAIRYGRRALRDVDANPQLGGRGTARAAKLLGIISIVAWVAVTISLIPAYVNARRAALRVQCLSQLRQIGMASMMYASSNRGVLPTSLDELAKPGLIPATVFTCPACAGDPSKPPASSGAYGSYNYVYLGNGQRLSTIGNPSWVPLAYEPPTNHPDGGINVLYMDGHAAVLKGAAAQTFLRQIVPATPRATTSSAPQVER
jgi:prepilin-type processing-associated H-X9-DG protein